MLASTASLRLTARRACAQASCSSLRSLSSSCLGWVLSQGRHAASSKLAFSRSYPASFELLGQGIRNLSSPGKVSFTIIDPLEAPEGKKIEANIGDSILDIAQKNDLSLEGACEGTLACSTCHCILPSDLFQEIDQPTEEELDLLDITVGLTET
eukprot:759209-Hanusia_phi.AAC.2